jgi:Fe2+ or Zn2+ uptake regulation protein
MEKIDLTRIYFFNNRAVKILREESDQFVLVQAQLNIDHDITGGNFCHGCMVGHYHHDCEQAGEVIEAVMENISDAEVFWVAKKYLQEEPFEYKEYQKLKEANKALTEQRDNLIDVVFELKKEESKLLDSCKGLQLAFQRKVEDKIALEFNYIASKLKHDELKDKIKESKSAIVKGTNVVISADRMLELLQADITLRRLKSGGVDNWEWYGESMKGGSVEKEAFETFKNL